MKFLDAWCTRTMRSRLGPMKKIAKSLRCHRHLILNWFRARGTISSGVVEGFNGKAKLTTRKAFGFRTPQGIEIALFHVLGRLPEPKFTHRFRRGGLYIRLVLLTLPSPAIKQGRTSLPKGVSLGYVVSFSAFDAELGRDCHSNAINATSAST